MKRIVVALVPALLLAGTASAEKINCSVKFRSGKQSFAQAQSSEREREKLMMDAVDQFRVAVEVCPETGEHHMHYAMALAEHGVDLLQKAYFDTQSSEEQEALFAKALDAFEKVGVQFDSATVVEDKKKLIKDVEENRMHYWVYHYNNGIKFMTEGENKNPTAAARSFKIARLIDPDEMKAYTQGAVTLIELGRKDEATDLVKAGLEHSPADTTLLKLRNDLYFDTAKTLIIEAEAEGVDPQQSVEKAKKSLEYLTALEALQPDSAGIYFEKGSAGAALGRSLGKTGADPAEIKKAFADAAASYEKAASLVDPKTDLEFHKAALMNRILVLLEAEENDSARDAAKAYCLLDPYDASLWHIIAVTLTKWQTEDPEVQLNTAVALMVKKSLEGGPIPVEDAVKNASEDSKAAVDQMGNPDAVYGYQEASGAQVSAWFWLAHRKVVCFSLGKKQGEMSW